MLGRNITTIQTFTFEDRNILKEQLKLDNFGEITINETPFEKIIQYVIDTNKCIRLKDLIDGIETDFIQIHLGQLIQLIHQLIIKVIILENNNIEHQYLDMNRIWLSLNENSPKFSIVYVQTAYTIHFTGYQCPFYEDLINQQIQSASQSIKIIIHIILIRCRDHIQFKAKDSSTTNQIIKDFFSPIITLCQNGSLFELQNKIQSLQKNFNYNQEQQTFQVDEQKNTQKQNSILKIQQNIGQMMQNYKDSEQLSQEFVYRQSILQIGSNLKNKQFNEKLNLFFCSESEQQIKQKQDLLKGYQEKYLNKVYRVVLDSVTPKFQKLQDYFKIFNEIDKNNIIQELNEIVKNSRLQNYFQNSIWFNLNLSEDQNTVFASLLAKKISPILEERCAIYLSNQILQLINELI